MGSDEPVTPTKQKRHGRNIGQPASQSGGKKGRIKKGDSCKTRFNKIIRQTKKAAPGSAIFKGLQSPGYEYLKNEEFLTSKTQRLSQTLLHMVVEELIQEPDEYANDDDDDDDHSIDTEENDDNPGLKLLAEALVKYPPCSMLSDVDDNGNPITYSMLACVDDNGSTPLHRAIKEDDDDVVLHLCDAALTVDNNSSLSEALGATSKKSSGNCIHEAMKSSLRADTIVRLVESARQDTLCAQDSKGLTAFHLAVHYNKCDEKEERLKIIDALIKYAEKALDVTVTVDTRNLSVYAYHNYTRKKCQPELEKKRKDLEKRRTEQMKANNRITQGDIEPKKIVAVQGPEMDPKKAQMLKASEKGSRKVEYTVKRTEKGVNREREEQKSQHGAEVIKQAQRQDSFKLNDGRQLDLDSMTIFGTLPRTPTHENSVEEMEMAHRRPVHNEPSSNPSTFEEEELRKLKYWESEANAVREYIKLYYLRTREPEKVVNWLYDTNPDGEWRSMSGVSNDHTSGCAS